VCITGVSGSGKSTLMVEILYKALARELHGAHTQPGDYERIEAWNMLIRLSTSTSRPLGAPRAPTPALTPACLTRFASCLRNCPKAKFAATKPGVSRSTSTAGAARPARDRANCASKCSSCPMSMCPAMCATARASTAKPCKCTSRIKIADVLDTDRRQALEFSAAFPSDDQQAANPARRRPGLPPHRTARADPYRAARRSASSWPKNFRAAPPAAPSTCSMSLPLACTPPMFTN
jgi:excinuclease ABC subunit A